MRSGLIVTTQRRPKLGCGPEAPAPQQGHCAERGAKGLSVEVGLQLHFPLTYLLAD